MGYGFMQCWTNNLDAYFHTGDAGMHSELFIIPDKMTGFYVVYTNINESAENPREELTKKILDKFFPAPQFVMPKPLADFAARASEYEGTFRINQYSRTNFEKLAALPNQGTCKNNGDGTLQLTLLGGGISEKLVEISKDLFRAEDNAWYAFVRDANGKIVALSIAGNISDPTGLEKIKWYDNTLFHLFIIAFVIILILLRLIMSVIKRAKKLFKSKQEQPIQTQAEKWAWKLPAMVSLLIIILPIIAFAGLAAIEKPFAGMPFFYKLF